MKHSTTTRWTGLAIVVALLAACSGSDDDIAADAATDTITNTVIDESVSTDGVTSTVSTTTTTTAVAATTEPQSPPTTSPPTTSPPTTEPCGSQCPLDDQQQLVVDEFFDSYNGDDWESFRATLVDDDVSWTFTPMLVQSEDLMRYDFVWSAGLNEVWTPEQCVDQYGIISCTVVIEDELHRGLAPFGFPSSRCSISFEIIDGAVRPLRYDALISGCHFAYDVAMHRFGGWLRTNHPELDPIDGVHYRGWNQTDETAPARALEYLDEWLVEVQQFVNDGGDIMSVSR